MPLVARAKDGIDTKGKTFETGQSDAQADSIDRDLGVYSRAADVSVNHLVQAGLFRTADGCDSRG